MDPGTVLAIVSLVIDVSKDLSEYYSLWKDRNEDLEKFRGALTWLRSLFESLQRTLNNNALNQEQAKTITESISSCETIISKLKLKLNKVKKETPPDTPLGRLDDQRRRALYPFRRSTIIKLCELIDELRDRMQMVATVLDVDTTAQVLQISKGLEIKLRIVSEGVNNMKNSTKTAQENENRRKVLEWLNPIDQSTTHNDARQKHEAGSGEWLFTNDCFRRWQTEAGSSLWLYGEGGCGKTVLLSSVVERIMTAAQSSISSNCSIAAYFYCLYRKGANHDLGRILRTFIAQTCSPGAIQDQLQKLYDQHSLKFPPGVPSDDELKQCFLKIISNSDQVFIMVDALDELPLGRSKADILAFFNELASSHFPNIHIFATSRNTSDIMLGLSFFSQLSVDKEMIIQDIRMYVNSQISQDSRLREQNPTIKDKIMKTLVDQCQGSFRWAALQLEELKVLTPLRPRSIQKTLDSLPRNLDETYERILNKIHPANSEEALNALQWISFATRPLYIEELVEVCAIDLSAQPEFETEERYEPLSILDLLPGLLSISPPFKNTGNIAHETHVVNFAHFTVLEYLLGTRIRSSAANLYSLEAQASNHFIARSCLAYLKCANTITLRNESYPLRSYCWDYWAWHTVQNSNVRSTEDQEFMKLTNEAQELFESVSQTIPKESELSNPVTNTNFRNLKTRLSDVAKWLPMTDLEELQFRRSLQIPFFYQEFEVSEGGHDNLFSFKFPELAGKCDIRLVELFPSARRFTEIRCRIFPVSLNSHPSYEGLSYYWGGSTSQISKLRANGRLLNVPKNLVSVLRNLRRKQGNQGQILFVDALCFKWLEDEEQDARVKLTPRIFQLARQVAIGLGESKEADADAIEFLRRVVSTSFCDLDLQRDPIKVSQILYGMSPEVVGRSVLQLFQRPWWRRMWPVQELILSKQATLYYGETAVTFDVFQEFFEMEDMIKELIGPVAYAELYSSKAWIAAQRISLIRQRYLLGHQPTLPALLWATQYHEAQHRIHKVYALIGLLCIEEQESELLNFRLAATEEEKFSRVAVHILRKHQNFDLLSYASCHPWKQHRDFPLPSWVPDFGAAGEDIVPFFQGSFGHSNSVATFTAGGSIREPPKLSTDMLTLTVEGMRVDILLLLHETFLGTETFEQLSVMYRSIQQLGIPLKQSKNCSALKSFWETLLAYQLESQQLLALQKGIDDTNSSNDNIEVHKQLSGMRFNLRYSKGRRLAISRSGYMCLVPSTAASGDLIVVIIGGSIPFLLRQVGNNYRLVGECYVHGIMNGEILAEKKLGESRIEDFVLE